MLAVALNTDAKAGRAICWKAGAAASGEWGNPLRGAAAIVGCIANNHGKRRRLTASIANVNTLLTLRRPRNLTCRMVPLCCLPSPNSGRIQISFFVFPFILVLVNAMKRPSADQDVGILFSSDSKRISSLPAPLDTF